MFRVGDKVVYPHHGAAIIKGVEEREVMGEKREYFVLRLSYGDLTLLVPLDNTEEVGIRAVEVDASDDAARRFYLKFGFVPLVDDPNHLFLTIHVIRKLGLPPLGGGSGDSTEALER